MNDERDIRWKQRFENFEKAFAVFERMIASVRKSRSSGEEVSEMQQMALIQSFEVVFELAWKTLSDFLKEQGYESIVSPRGVIKQSFESEYIDSGEVWLRALADRNATTHMYDEKEIRRIVEKIDIEYSTLLESLHRFFLSKK
jgi:nucleotidyltransferase substrate binding protein (TIGR01987 family)